MKDGITQVVESIQKITGGLQSLAARIRNLEVLPRASTVKIATIFTIEGDLIAPDTNPLRIYNRWGVTRTITEVMINVDTAPTGQAIIVDVHKGGTTIFTTQANRPQIAASAYTGSTTTVEVYDWLVDEYLQIIVDQVGSVVAGSNLTVSIIHS